ncbi:MAG TPA: lysylphosphatidylglycerol synthase transmembrane domain-containing protein [Bryobacteraceae bacterium]|nr:lysylphosphatidylglycerol synthase transmembrane domain-containing protein [Bryobacteraceae bacterium]
MTTHIAALRPAAERRKKVRSWAIFIVTNIFSLVCLTWVLSGAGLGDIWNEVQHMHWGWVIVAVGTDVMVYMLHALRWKLLLRPVEKVSYLSALQAIYVGLFANEVLPLRAGELIRCFLLSRATELPISVTFASALIERIFDGIWLMTCFFFTLHMGRLPVVLIKGGYILGFIIVLAGLILGFAMYAKQQQLDVFFGIAWPGWFNTLIEDLHLIGHSRYLYFAFFASGAYLLAQVLPVYALVKANNLPVPLAASFTMMVLLRLSAVVPQAPGNLGSFQWVAARTLIMFGLGTRHSKDFSMILWAVVTLPLILIGFLCLTATGMKMGHLHREASAAARKPKEAPAA